MGIKYRLSVIVVVDDFLATVSADTQLDSSDFIAVVVLHIVRSDVGYLAVDGVLYGVDITYLSATGDLNGL